MPQISTSICTGINGKINEVVYVIDDDGSVYRLAGLNNNFGVWQRLPYFRAGRPFVPETEDKS